MMATPEKLRNALYRISSDCAVNNWDSYGANPVTKAALEAGWCFIALLEKLQVVPTNEGGIQFEASGTGEDFIEIEFDSNGEMHWCCGPCEGDE
jgi:hypothetical protein